MKADSFVYVDEVAADLGVCQSHAYKVIRKLNEELKAKGYITISGRVSRKFYEKRFYATDNMLGDESLDGRI